MGAIFTVVASLFLWQWQLSSLAVGSSSVSGNFITGNGNALCILFPTGIDEDDYDSERDILILGELVDNYSLSLPKNESFRFDIPSLSRPPAKPPDGNTGILNIKMMGDNFEQKLSSILEKLKTLAKGFYPPSLHILSFSWESSI
nr:hypothetical protein [Tanacetum cinerariifolium]